jgi:hypothetical protein
MVILWPAVVLVGVKLVITGVAAVMLTLNALDAVPPTVTITGEEPTASAGTVAVMEVLVTAVTGALVPPIVTVAPEAKFVPVIASAVPGLAEAGLTPEIVGVTADTVSGNEPVDWPFTVITTLGVPAATEGTIKVSCVLLCTVTPEAAALPTTTVAPAAKLLPVAVMVVPGVAAVGLSEVRVGITACVVTHGPVALTVMALLPKVTEPVVQLVPLMMTCWPNAALPKHVASAVIASKLRKYLFM